MTSSCEDRAVVRVSTSSGAIRVVGEDRPDVVVERGRAKEADGEVAVEGSSKSIVVRCPVGTVSGKVTVTLPPGRHPAIDARSSKKPRIEVEPGVDGKVRAAMVSGRLT